MREEKDNCGNDLREGMYIRNLIILTAITLAFVFTAFWTAGASARNAGGEDTGTSGVQSAEDGLTSKQDLEDDTSVTTITYGITEPPVTIDHGTSYPAGTTYPIETITPPDTNAPKTTGPDIPVITPSLDYMPKTTSATQTINKTWLNAGSAVLVDLSNNIVLASYRADWLIYPASMTKVMTLIVACENINNLEDTFTMTQAIIDRAYLAGASRAGFAAGETITMLDLLYGAALPSGADATDALAIHVAGSEEEFVKLMNKKAQDLGLEYTQFANASGLHNEAHFSTVREIAAIMACAMDNPLVAQLLSSRVYTTSNTPQHQSGITFYSTGFSRMSTSNFGRVSVVAVKTGFTDEARFCFASCSVSDEGGKYILITAQGSSRSSSIDDCSYVYGSYIK